MFLPPDQIWKRNADIWELCKVQSGMGDRIPPFRAVFLASLIEVGTNEVALQSVAPNVVLQGSLDSIIRGNSPKYAWNYMGIGTVGASTPLDSHQAGLINPISVAIAGGVLHGPSCTGPKTIDSYSWSYTGYWPSAFGNGDLREVGMTGFNLPYLNRALFLDLDGVTPLTMTKTSAFYLSINAQIAFTFKRI